MKQFWLLMFLLIFITGCSVSISNNDLSIIPVEEKPAAYQSSVQYDEYWEAMRRFDFDYVNRNEVPELYQQFCAGLQMLFEGKYSASELLFEEFVDLAPDSIFHHNAALVLGGLYDLSNKWQEMVVLETKTPEEPDNWNSMNMIKYYAKGDAETITFPDTAVTLKTELSISGVPMVEVEVNGVKKVFWVDTGASLSVLASDCAEDCGVTLPEDNKFKIGTSTDAQVVTWPGIIEEMKIGGITLENHRAFIIDKKDLEFKLFGFIKLVKIDGIVGWNFIRETRMELDYKNQVTTIEKPVIIENSNRNFHFETVPFVTLTDTLGNPFQFFLDTGANSTDFYEFALAKLDTSAMKSSKAIQGGAGGTVKLEQHSLENQSLVLKNQRINFPEIAIKPDLGEDDSEFFNFDGVMGSDVAKSGKLILDFQNGLCEIVVE